MKNIVEFPFKPKDHFWAIQIADSSEPHWPILAPEEFYVDFCIDSEGGTFLSAIELSTKRTQGFPIDAVGRSFFETKEEAVEAIRKLSAEVMYWLSLGHQPPWMQPSPQPEHD